MDNSWGGLTAPSCLKGETLLLLLARFSLNVCCGFSSLAQKEAKSSLEGEPVVSADEKTQQRLELVWGMAWGSRTSHGHQQDDDIFLLPKTSSYEIDSASPQPVSLSCAALTVHCCWKIWSCFSQPLSGQLTTFMPSPTVSCPSVRLFSFLTCWNENLRFSFCRVNFCRVKNLNWYLKVSGRYGKKQQCLGEDHFSAGVGGQLNWLGLISLSVL